MQIKHAFLSCLFASSFVPGFSTAQSAHSYGNADQTLRQKAVCLIKDTIRSEKPPLKIDKAAWIVPSALIGYGFTAYFHNSITQKWDGSIATSRRKSFPNFCSKADEYLPYAPAAAVFALNAIGVKGKHSWQEAVCLYAASFVAQSGAVFIGKRIFKQERPDGSDNKSFISGHAARAFQAAEFLRREYGAVSPWIAVAGYASATGVAVLRILNNRHWASNVCMGAGIGILSSSVTYFIYDNFLQQKFCHSTVIPFYADRTLGVSYTMVF